MTSAAEHLTLIEDCEARESRLSDSQRTYLDSFRRQIEAGNTLTKKQADVLDDIWDSATARG